MLSFIFNLKSVIFTAWGYQVTHLEFLAFVLLAIGGWRRWLRIANSEKSMAR